MCFRTFFCKSFSFLESEKFLVFLKKIEFWKTSSQDHRTYHDLSTYDNVSLVITSYDKLGDLVVGFSRTSLFFFQIFFTLMKHF